MAERDSIGDTPGMTGEQIFYYTLDLLTCRVIATRGQDERVRRQQLRESVDRVAALTADIDPVMGRRVEAWLCDHIDRELAKEADHA